MKDFVKKLQKDLNVLKKDLEKESNELLKRVKTLATKENLMKKGKEIEVVVEKQLKRFEPTLNKVLQEVRKNARKAGLDVDKIEKSLRTNLTTARKTFESAAKKTTSKGKKASPTKKAASKARPAKPASDETSAPTVEL